MFLKFPLILFETLFLSSFFLKRNEAKKSSWLLNRFAFKVVRHDTVFQKLIR